jgi:hypothetical protein
MKFINNIIQKIMKKRSEIKPLGRWNIENCDNKINKKIDFSNEDHCGPCGNNFFLNQINIKTPKENQKI